MLCNQAQETTITTRADKQPPQNADPCMDAAALAPMITKITQTFTSQPKFDTFDKNKNILLWASSE